MIIVHVQNFKLRLHLLDIENAKIQTGNGNSRITLTAEQCHRGPFPVATWTPEGSWRSSIASLGPIEYQMPYRAEGWYLRLHACTWGSCSRSSSPEERSGTARTWRPPEPPSSSRIAFVGYEVPLMVVRWTRKERWWTLDGFPLSALKSRPSPLTLKKASSF